MEVTKDFHVESVVLISFVLFKADVLMDENFGAENSPEMSIEMENRVCIRAAIPPPTVTLPPVTEIESGKTTSPIESLKLPRSSPRELTFQISNSVRDAIAVVVSGITPEGFSTVDGIGVGVDCAGTTALAPATHKEPDGAR